MTEATLDGILPLHVHVKSMPARTLCTRKSTYSTVVLNGTDKTAALIMGRSLHRVALTVSFLGQSTDVAYLCGSLADAQQLNGAEFMGLQVTPLLPGTEEVWVAVAAGVSMRFGVVATFED